MTDVAQAPPERHHPAPAVGPGPRVVMTGVVSDAATVIACVQFASSILLDEVQTAVEELHTLIEQMAAVAP